MRRRKQSPVENFIWHVNILVIARSASCDEAISNRMQYIPNVILPFSRRLLRDTPSAARNDMILFLQGYFTISRWS
jgi:hypothetical protein